MEGEIWLFLLVAGGAVGLVSSFFGVGACFIMVPVMIFCLERFMGVSPSLAPLIAFGTNMAVVVPTSLSGVLRHRRELKRRGLRFPTKHYLYFAPFVGLGSLLGSALAFTIFSSFRKEAGIMLKMIFGLVCLLGAYRFLRARPIPISELREPNKVKYLVAGLLGGLLAHFIGIGGGIVYMPLLNAVLKVPVHYAVGLSLATMVVGSSVGASSFALLGRIDQLSHPSDYPPFSFGWLNLVCFVGLGLSSVILAQVGPYIAHRTSPEKYKLLLALVYTYIGVRLVVRGAFQLAGIPPPIP